MSTITLSGTITPTPNETDTQIKQDALNQVNKTLVGRGITADANLVTITHNQDGSVSWSYTLDAPDNVDTEDTNSATNKLGSLANDSDNGFTDVYNIMAEFFRISNEIRSATDISDKTRLDAQVGKLKEAAHDTRSGALDAMIGELVMGAAMVVAGSVEIAGASSMKGVLSEASESNEQAMQEARIARTTEMGPAPKAPSAALEIDDASEDSIDNEDLEAPKRKNADADLNESIQNGDPQDADVDVDVNQKSPQELQLETEQKVQKQKQEASEAENDSDAKRAQRHRENAEDLKRQADYKTKGMGIIETKVRGVGAMAQGIGGIIKAIGDYGNANKQADSQVAEADATKEAAYRDYMGKVRDNSVSAMQAALQGMQQAVQTENSMIQKIFV